jgi:lysophospholipase L1-like esterase
MNRKLALALVCAGIAGPALAQPNATWVGAWGFPASPAQPGIAPAMVTQPANFIPPPVEPGQRNPFLPLREGAPGSVAAIPAYQTPDLADVTVRQLVRVSVPGRQIRICLSNEGAAGSLAIASVHVAKAGADGDIVAGSDHLARFGGQTGILVPDGAPMLSDPIDMGVSALEELAISVELPGRVPPSGHELWQYVSPDASAAGDIKLPDVQLMHVPAIITEVDVNSPSAHSVVVALGDSITEGAQSTTNAFRSWPDRLAERLAGSPDGSGWAVVNAGISGNRLLHYGAGPDALARLDRDVFAVPGVKVAILLEGINDIGRAFPMRPPPLTTPEPVTAEQLIAADQQIIARAHERGIRVIGTTLTPFEGAAYYSQGGETMREKVNQWIRTAGAFDGVIDFDAVTRDPSDLLTFRPDYNDFDHLHPNDKGYKAMADAIDLKLITEK